MFEKVSDFPDLWRSVCECCPFGVMYGGGGAVGCVSFSSILCFRLVIRLLGKLFLWAICSILPFFMALFLWDGEGEHSVDEESISC